MHEALRAWMQANGYTNSSLAEKLDVSYELVYKVVENKIVVSNNFKWRFGKVFGFDEADRIFSGLDEAEHVAA